MSGKLVSEEEKEKIRKRDAKTMRKYIYIDSLQSQSFERTVEEVKHRYYDVAKALLKHRNEENHRILKYPSFNMVDDLLRKHNWEKVYSRNKNEVEKET
jgi:hypothetical protein